MKWRENVNRNQVLGSFSTLHERAWAGTHNLKVGFELYRDTAERNQTGYPQNLLLEFNNGAAIAVRQYIPSFSINRLFAGGHLRHGYLERGIASDTESRRACRSLPVVPAGAIAARQPVRAAATFAAVDDVITWNLPAPRFGITYKLDEARQDGDQGERRPLLVESRRQRRIGSVNANIVDRLRTVRVDRSERGSQLRVVRARPAALAGWRRGPLARSESREQLHRRTGHLARSRTAAELRAPHRRGVARAAPASVRR